MLSPPRCPPQAVFSSNLCTDSRVKTLVDAGVKVNASSLTQSVCLSTTFVVTSDLMYAGGFGFVGHGEFAPPALGSRMGYGESRLRLFAARAETHLMQEQGLTFAQALQTVTRLVCAFLLLLSLFCVSTSSACIQICLSNPADIFGLSWGRIQLGNRANFLLFDGDPLTTIGITVSLLGRSRL